MDCSYLFEKPKREILIIDNNILENYSYCIYSYFGIDGYFKVIIYNKRIILYKLVEKMEYSSKIEIYYSIDYLYGGRTFYKNENNINIVFCNCIFIITNDNNAYCLEYEKIARTSINYYKKKECSEYYFIKNKNIYVLSDTEIFKSNKQLSWDDIVNFLETKHGKYMLFKDYYKLKRNILLLIIQGNKEYTQNKKNHLPPELWNKIYDDYIDIILRIE